MIRPMTHGTRNCLWSAVVLVAVPCVAQTPEKQLVVTITSQQLKNGVVTELTWDGGTLVIQGAFADASGRLAAQYFATPADDVSLVHWPDHSPASRKYWETKSRRISPTGLGRISLASDSALPIYGIGSLEQRMGDSVAMGGTIARHVLKLHTLTIHERTSPAAPYDGETWSWSPLELNRIAYVDGKGDLWVAAANGTSPKRIAKGNFTLPAWSDDGRVIAVVERKGGRWEVSVIHLPADLRRH